MKAILLVFCAALAGGCSHIEYRNGGEYASRWALGVNVDAQELEIVGTPDGGRRLTAKGVRSDSTEAIEAAVRAAVSEAIKGVKP